jgi:hypothetical protein
MENPFLSKVTTPTLKYEGEAILTNAGKIDLDRDEESTSTSAVRDLTIITEIEVKLGWFAYLTHGGKTMSGQIASVNSDIKGVQAISLDLSKKVPFKESAIAPVPSVDTAPPTASPSAIQPL